VSIPGSRTAELRPRLREYESRNVTYLGDDFPVFWESADGATVTDVDGNCYIDCAAAFGVANVGHSNPRVVAAISEQARRLIHGMGDVHPTAVRVQLFERLRSILPRTLERGLFASSGSEAIEAALKTAMLVTGKSRFAAYRGGYHGLSFGALAVAGIERFRSPFAAALGADPILLEYPRAGRQTAHAAAGEAARLLRAHDDVAALVIEPIQGRAGCIVPPLGYLAALRSMCDELGIVMIVDEIFTGFGRTGAWFAVDRESVVPDILCLGKAMTSGLPMSAAIGRAPIMDAWPVSTGEALHTSTHLGNPLGCAAAIATIDELERLELPARAARLGKEVGSRLESFRALPSVADVRGCGLLWAVELRHAEIAARVVKRALARGLIVLQSGTEGESVTIAPPLVIGDDQMDRALDILESLIAQTSV
jgi:4-aminobutyrate aminotransferase-like enzyme